MKSRISFCNAAILKKQLFRGIPLWGVYLAGWMIALPLNLLSQSQWLSEMDAKVYVMSLAAGNTHLIPALYGLAAACLLFSHLYQSRSANFFAALPLRRETMFLTNYVTGLLFFAVPALLVTGCTILAGFGIGYDLVKEALVFLGVSTLSYVFFYSFSVLCAMAVGHLVALPLLFAVLNFTTVVVEAIVKEILSTFVYGLYFYGSLRSSAFSPLFHLLIEEPMRVRSVYGEIAGAHALTDYTVHNWEILPIYCAVGVAFAVAAFLMYKYRRMESAADVIAVKKLKPVFLYCFSIGCSLVIGMLLSTLVLPGSDSANFIPVALCLLAGAVIGYFVGEMMLHKSLRVFRKRYWLNCGVVCAVILAALLCCRFDLFGFSRYVPEPEDVQSVSLNNEFGAKSQDPAQIQRVIRLHRDIIDRQSETEALLRSDAVFTPSATITYVLHNGREVSRRYNIPVTKESAADSGSLIRQMEAALNDPDYTILRQLPDHYGRENLTTAYVFHETRQTEPVYLSLTDGYNLLKAGIEADIRAGTLGTNYWTDELVYVTDKGAPMQEYAVEEEQDNWTGYHVEFQFEDVEDQQYCYFSVRKDHVHTIAVMEQLGFTFE